MTESAFAYVFSTFRAHLSNKLQGLSIFRPIIYGNTAEVMTPEERAGSQFPDHTHRWTVAVRSAASKPNAKEVGGADDISHFIKRVTFKLHDTYAVPNRSALHNIFHLSDGTELLYSCRC